MLSTLRRNSVLILTMHINNIAAEKYGLSIVSFDSDFDRTEKGRKPPDNIKS